MTEEISKQVKDDETIMAMTQISRYARRARLFGWAASLALLVTYLIGIAVIMVMLTAMCYAGGYIPT